MILKKMGPLLRFITGFVLIFSLLSQGVFAYDLIDLEKKARLTIVFSAGSRKAANTRFRLYYAAGVSQSCKFTLSDKFSSYSLSLENPDSAEWRALAQTMAGYAAADSIPADAEGTTGSEGTVIFSDLNPGLYLVTGSGCSIGSDTYTPQPFLICLPNYDRSGSWQYDVTAEVKYESEYHGDGSSDSSVVRRVLKSWKNDDGDSRPEEISVTLLKNGEEYETVSLNEGNNWRYMWSGLSKSAEWNIVEKNVPENYTVTVSKEGITFLVTNTYRKPVETGNPDPPGSTGSPSDPDSSPGTGSPNNPSAPNDPSAPGNPNHPTDPDNPSVPDHPENPSALGGSDMSDEPNIPALPGTPGISENDNTPPENPNNSQVIPSQKLPQTGMLWWPVPFLAIGGILIFIIGWIKQRTDGKSDET